MTEYIYGIVGAAMPPPSESGIHGAPVRVLAHGGAAALVSDLPERELNLGRSELEAHARVLESALTAGTVLPMRFGVVMEDDAEVDRRLLSDHEDELRRQLEAFSGKVEMSVRAVYEEDALMRRVLGAEPEIRRLRDSLRGRSEDATYFDRIRLGELVSQTVDRMREADAQAILEILCHAAIDASSGEPAHERMVFTGSFLVARDQLEDFDRILDAVASERAELMRFRVTGPLPPHSFVELAESA